MSIIKRAFGLFTRRRGTRVVSAPRVEPAEVGVWRLGRILLDRPVSEPPITITIDDRQLRAWVRDSVTPPPGRNWRAYLLKERRIIDTTPVIPDIEPEPWPMLDYPKKS